MHPDEVLPKLNRLPIFASLTADEALAVAEKCRIALYKPGGILFREDQFGDTLMIVLKGSVQVSCKAEEGVTVELAILKEGSMIGEMALIDPAPRSATATAITETLVLLVDGKTLDDLINASHPAASRIMQTILQLLAQRFRTVDKRLEEVFLARMKETPLRM